MPPGNKPGANSAATNVSGRSAMHPTMGMTWKRAIKIERIARLSADPAGYSNEQIANMLSCDKQTIVLIRQTPEYHAKMIEISSGVISQYDAQLRENVDNMREEIRTMVPSSMMVIRNALVGRYGSALQFKAATEVLDREGTIAKVSKSSVTVEHKPSLDVDPTIASNLMALFASAPASGALATGSANINGFTRTAQEAGLQQASMADTNNEATLEMLDLSNSKPN